MPWSAGLITSWRGRERRARIGRRRAAAGRRATLRPHAIGVIHIVLLLQIHRGVLRVGGADPGADHRARGRTAPGAAPAADRAAERRPKPGAEQRAAERV